LAKGKLLETPADPNEDVIEILYNSPTAGPTVLRVTREARDCMRYAVDISMSQPNIFFKCEAIVKSVAKILKKNFVEYSFPQSHEDLEHIKWDDIYADDSKTYPKGELPTKDEYAQVKRVYEFVIEEKDRQARALGKPKSGALRYGTIHQRWQQWRDYCAVARITNPTMSAQSCLDLLTVWLKNCSSKDQIDIKLKEAIGKYKNKLYREQCKHLEIEKD
jgi:hypothetical protein